MRSRTRRGVTQRMQKRKEARLSLPVFVCLREAAPTGARDFHQTHVSPPPLVLTLHTLPPSQNIPLVLPPSLAVADPYTGLCSHAFPTVTPCLSTMSKSHAASTTMKPSFPDSLTPKLFTTSKAFTRNSTMAFIIRYYVYTQLHLPSSAWGGSQPDLLVLFETLEELLNLPAPGFLTSTTSHKQLTSLSPRSVPLSEVSLCHAKVLRDERMTVSKGGKKKEGH